MSSLPQKYQSQRMPNQDAHLLLTLVIERVGLNKRSFLERLADLGYAYNDDDFSNWGRAGRSFPRNWTALRAMVQVVTDGHPVHRRCTASEALQFLGLVGMPFPELQSIATLFTAQEFAAALALYLPPPAPSRDDTRFVPPQLERRQADRSRVAGEHSRSASQGLLALTALMDMPDVRAAVGAFRTEFEAACVQIEVLAALKYLHDLFQQLEDRYNLIYHDARRLPVDQTAWAGIERNEPETEAIVDELLEVAEQPIIASEATLWKHKLARARDELRSAIEQEDVEHLRQATTRFKDVLGRELSRVNTRLISTAGTLRLATLVQAMTTVRDSLASHELERRPAPQVDAFEQGVHALTELDHSLTTLITTHNMFQEIDDELRRIEALVDQDIVELSNAWPELSQLVENLCRSTSAPWAEKLIIRGAELEETFKTSHTGKTIRVFRSYRSLALRGFNQIDRDLLTLCEALQQVGQSLSTLLRVIA